MNILSTLEESINLNKLKDCDQNKIKNAFFANYLGGLLLLRLQDIKGLMLINDRAHSKLTSFSAMMSDLNFWGRALFYSNENDVKNRMQPGEAAALAKEAGRISTSRIQKIMQVPLTAPAHVDWAETIASLLLMKHRFSLRSSYFDHIVSTLYDWDSIGIPARQKAIGNCLMYLMQSDQHSNLLSRLRTQSTATMVSKMGSIAQRIVSFTKLNEDGEGGGGDGGAILTGNVASNSIVTPDTGTAGSESSPEQNLGGLFKLIRRSPNQVTKKSKFNIRNGKLVVKRAKNFDVKKFKAPDFLKPAKKKESKEIENEVA